MRKSPIETINKAMKSKLKSSKKLCQFFEGETSLEKIEKIDELTSRMMSACEKVGITLPKENIHNKIVNLPFFVIRKGLAMQGDTSVEECELMKKKYK